MGGVHAPAADVGLLAAFAVGLLGGAHCLGMCGPLVTAYADRLSTREALSTREVRQHLLFNAGRTAGYATAGAALGALGGLAFDAGSLVAAGDAVRGATGVALGAVVLAAGAAYLLRGTAALAPLERATRSVTGRTVGDVTARATGALVSRVDGWVGGPRIAGLGVAHALLPCPILYPAYLYALARGSAVDGALALGAVGLGTFPTLFLYGTAVGTLGVGSRRRLHRALGVAFLALGYVPLAHGLALLGVPAPQPPHLPYGTFGG